MTAENAPIRGQNFLPSSTASPIQKALAPTQPTQTSVGGYKFPGPRPMCRATGAALSAIFASRPAVRRKE